MLEILQTTGICVGGLSLLAIAFMMFMLMMTLPTVPVSEEDEAQQGLEWLRGKSPEEIDRILRTPIYDDLPPTRRGRPKKKEN